MRRKYFAFFMYFITKRLYTSDRIDISLLRNDQENIMLTVLVFLFLLIVFDIAAMRWGFTSSDGPESKEWERRQQRAWLQECEDPHSAKHVAGTCKLENAEAYLLEKR